MKKLLLVFFVSIIFISCDKLDEPDVLGSYLNTPDNCDSFEKSGFWCSRFITLSAGGVADVLLGGDMVFRTTYKIKGEKIKIQKSDQFEKEMTFIRLVDGSLRYEADKTIWIKSISTP